MADYDALKKGEDLLKRAKRLSEEMSQEASDLEGAIGSGRAALEELREVARENVENLGYLAQRGRETYRPPEENQN